MTTTALVISGGLIVFAVIVGLGCLEALDRQRSTRADLMDEWEDWYAENMKIDE